MLFRFFILLLVLLGISTHSMAQEETTIKRIAVLEFRGVGIEPTILLKLSDQSRGAAVDILDKEEYLIMTRENMMQVLEDMGKDASCMEGSCEVEIGRNIGADVVITGDILQIKNIYVLTLKLYETKNGALLKTQEVENADLLALKTDTYEQSLQLLKEGLGLEGYTPKKRKKKLSMSQKYTWAAGGLLAASAPIYMVTISSYNSYIENPNNTDAVQAYRLNNISHTTALSLSALSIGAFTLSRLEARKEKKENSK